MASLTAPAYASGTIVSDATVPTAADTVTVGGQVYTFRASVSTTANEVKIGAAGALEAMQNLCDAINGVANGTTVGSLTVANPDVVATVSGLTVTVKSRVPGTVGNYLPLTESGTHTSIGSAATKLAGGTGSHATSISELLAGCQLNAEVIQLLKSIDGDPNSN